jgi:phosphoribosylformylglycinamidine synthase
VDLDSEAALQRFLVEAARCGLLRSAHDCSAGGLAVTLAEAAIGGPYATTWFGAKVLLPAVPPGEEGQAALLYGEDHGRAVLSATAANEAALLALAAEHQVPAAAVGTVGVPDGELVIVTPGGRYVWATQQLRTIYLSAIPRRMSHVDEDRAGAS